MAFVRPVALVKGGMDNAGNYMDELLVLVGGSCRGGGGIPARVPAPEVADGLCLALGGTMWYYGGYVVYAKLWMERLDGLYGVLCF